MHSILWASILASAGVAVVTTLLVEYLAKPWLEARKDRILEKSTERRAGINNIMRAAFLLTRLAAYLQGFTLSDSEVERVAKIKTELLECTADAYGLLLVDPNLSDMGWSTLAAYIEDVAVIGREAESPEILSNYLRSLIRKLALFHTYLVMPRRRFRKKRNMVREIKSFQVTAKGVFKSDEENNSLPD